MGSSIRRWLRLSLREILLLVAIVGLVGGLVGGLRTQRQRHQRELAELRTESFKKEWHAYTERMRLFHEWVRRIDADLEEFRDTEVAGRTIREWKVGFRFPSTSSWDYIDEFREYSDRPVLDPECRVWIVEPDTPPAVIRAALIFAVYQVWSRDLGLFEERDADMIVEHYRESRKKGMQKRVMCSGGYLLVVMWPARERELGIQVRSVNQEALDKLLEEKGIGFRDIEGEDLLQWWSVEEINQLYGPRPTAEVPGGMLAPAT